MGFAPHIVTLIKTLYTAQRSNVRVHGQTSNWFTVLKGVRQGCLLSPYLFNIMAELLMRVALDGYEGGFRVGGRLINNLRFADDIVLVASSEAELQELVTRLYGAASDMGMRINAKKTEVMKVCDDDTPPMSITVNGEPITEVTSFKYLGARFNSKALCDEEIKTRLALARERMGKLDPLWRSRAISPPLKARLIQTLVWPIVTYGAEAWTLTKDLRGNIEAFEMQCYRRSMKISYRDHVPNETVLEKVDQNRKLLPMLKSRKLKYFGHISRHTSLEKDIMLGTMPGLRRQGANGKNGLMTWWNGQARQYRTWSGRQTIDWHFYDSFMRSPTLARRVRHLD